MYDLHEYSAYTTINVFYDSSYCVRTPLTRKEQKLPPTHLESSISKDVALLNPPYIAHIYLQNRKEVNILILHSLTKTAIYFFGPRSMF